MNTALRIFAVLSSGLAILITSWLLYDTFTVPLFLLLFYLLTCLYLAHLLEWFTLPHLVRHAAYFSSAAVHLLATLIGVFAFGVALFFIASFPRESSKIPLNSLIISVAFISYALIAPAGLFAILRLNSRSRQNASLLRGLLISLPLAGLVFAPEYLWIKYHEQRLATAQADDVISSLHSLSHFPISQNKMGLMVCKSLLTRDIGDPFFMYNDNDTTFRADNGVGKIETSLRTRFGEDGQKVISEVKTTFGRHIMGLCADWTNPNN